MRHRRLVRWDFNEIRDVYGAPCTRTRRIKLALVRIAAAASTSAITIPTRLTKISSQPQCCRHLRIAFIATDTGRYERHPALRRAGSTTIHSIGQSTDTVLNIRSIPARVSWGRTHTPDAVASHGCIRSRVCQRRLCVCVCARAAMESDNSFERAKDEVQESCYRDCCHR